MIRSVIPVAILILAATPAFAQRGGFSPERMQQRQEEQITEMSERLVLTDEQKPVFIKIMKEALDSRLELFGSMRDGGDRSSMRKKMQELTKKANAALKDVLTEDQMTQFLSLQRDGRRRAGRRQN